MGGCITAEGGMLSQGALQAHLAAAHEHKDAAIAGHKQLQRCS